MDVDHEDAPPMQPHRSPEDGYGSLERGDGIRYLDSSLDSLTDDIDCTINSGSSCSFGGMDEKRRTTTTIRLIHLSAIVDWEIVRLFKTSIPSELEETLGSGRSFILFPTNEVELSDRTSLTVLQRSKINQCGSSVDKPWGSWDRRIERGSHRTRCAH